MKMKKIGAGGGARPKFIYVDPTLRPSALALVSLPLKIGILRVFSVNTSKLDCKFLMQDILHMIDYLVHFSLDIFTYYLICHGT